MKGKVKIGEEERRRRGECEKRRCGYKLVSPK
jgi:hypothetical protein